MKKDNLEILAFLPEDQIRYLQELVRKNEGNPKALNAVDMIIKTIKIVETTFEGSGQEVLKGAHIVMEDKTEYDSLINSTNNRYRISSHYPNNKVKEKGIDLNHHSEFLVGLAKENKNQNFWMQLDAHAVDFKNGLIRGAILFVLHMIDFIKYRCTGKNVGPCGLSKFTEKKPIRLEKKHLKPHSNPRVIYF